ncbi:MAG: hypothetical protein HQK79_17375 [Desulfobacterales bacterium]|nr:hypothetical protein [Desulfobacterales bacterium]
MVQTIKNEILFSYLRPRLEAISNSNTSQCATLYSECAEEDRELAEDGMTEYCKGLLKEDKAEKEKYPLRGKLIEYDDPFEPVATKDWEVLK